MSDSGFLRSLTVSPFALLPGRARPAVRRRTKGRSQALLDQVDTAVGGNALHPGTRRRRSLTVWPASTPSSPARFERPVDAALQAQGRHVHAGMPPLQDGQHYPYFKRWIPERLFYLVPAVMWLILSARHRSATLPSAANPKMEAGGLWGESKVQDMAFFGPIARRWTAPSVVVGGPPCASEVHESLAAARSLLANAGLTYPLVAKPDRGYQGWGVKRIPDEAALERYLATLRPGEQLILQEFVQGEGEAGIFYVREPGQTSGRITSMALTYAPHVVGNGRATLAALVGADRVLRKSATLYRAEHGEGWNRILPVGEIVVLTNVRSARVGAIYRDARDLITPALTRRIDAITRDIEDFHVGRFDIRFASVEGLQRGEGLVVLELNGAGGEMLHIWDGRTRLRDAYRTLWRQYRILFDIGARNAQRGHRPTGLMGMIRLQRQQELLRRGYPPSN